MINSNEVVTPLKTSSECVDRGVFKFENGDSYWGYFRATSKKELYREGLGKYFCADKESYYGSWQKDQLLSARCITFKDRSTYKGLLNNMQVVGKGIYEIPSIGELNIDFEENKPSGEINMKDVNGFNWKGTCENNSAILYPVNQFKIYRNILIDRTQLEMEEEARTEFEKLLKKSGQLKALN